MTKLRFAFAGCALLALSACDDPQTAMRTLDDAGYTEIQAGGYDFLMCGKDDAFSTHFTATNARGKRVAGTVCSGWGKGATIRF